MIHCRSKLTFNYSDYFCTLTILSSGISLASMASFYPAVDPSCEAADADGWSLHQQPFISTDQPFSHMDSLVKLERISFLTGSENL